MHEPVVGMNDLRLLKPDDAAQRQHYLWIRKWRSVLPPIVAEEPRHSPHRGADSIHPHTPVQLEFRLTPVQQRDNGHVVLAGCKLDAEVPNVLLFSSNNGWIELRKHQDAHIDLRVIVW